MVAAIPPRPQNRSPFSHTSNIHSLTAVPQSTVIDHQKTSILVPIWSGLTVAVILLVGNVVRTLQGTRSTSIMAAFSGDRFREMRMRSSSSDKDNEPHNELAAKPKPLLQPKTPVGEFLHYILDHYPHLFEESVQNQIEQLCNAKESQSTDLSQVSETNLTLYKRIVEVKETEERRALEDILYYSVLQAFVKLGVSNIETHQLEDTAAFVQRNAERLVTVVHSQEEKEVVLAHMKKTLGPMMSFETMFSQAKIKMLKLQAFEIFASSLLFGYFLRHTYKRFSLARSLGMLPADHKENVALLEALFEKSDSDTGNPDAAAPIEGPIEQPQSEMTLKKYIERMDPSELSEQRLLASLESTQMVQDYLHALFGDVKIMVRKIQEVVNEPYPATSPDEYTERMKAAVEMNKVDVLEISLAGMQRMVLEAVAFGSFLKDAESFVEVNADKPLLTKVVRKGNQGPGSTGPLGL